MSCHKSTRVCCIFFIWWFILACGIIMCTISGIMLRDFSTIDGYHPTNCNRQASYTHIDSTGYCYRAKAYTTLAVDNHTVVKLRFPSGNFQILCKSQSEVEDWVANLNLNASIAPTVNCYVEKNALPGSIIDGVTEEFDQAGWVAMMFFGVVLCIIGVFTLGPLIGTLCCEN